MTVRVRVLPSDIVPSDWQFFLRSLHLVSPYSTYLIQVSNYHFFASILLFSFYYIIFCASFFRVRHF